MRLIQQKKLMILLIVLLVLSMTANFYLSRRFIKNPKNTPNFYMPKSFIFKYPDCANEYIEELGIDNVKVEAVVLVLYEMAIDS